MLISDMDLAKEPLWKCAKCGKKHELSSIFCTYCTTGIDPGQLRLARHDKNTETLKVIAMILVPVLLLVTIIIVIL